MIITLALTFEGDKGANRCFRVRVTQHLMKENETLYPRTDELEKSRRYRFQEREYGKLRIRWRKPAIILANTSPIVSTTQKHDDQVDNPLLASHWSFLEQ